MAKRQPSLWLLEAFRVHYQNHQIITMSHGSSNSTQQWYYGYAPRTLPCASDGPTCAYFEALWSSNDRGILYSGILWIPAGVAVLAAAVLRRALLSRHTRPFPTAPEGESLIGIKRPSRLRAAAASARRYLLPDSIHFLFGRTTRLQVLVLAILMAYLTIFSFVGITYAMWPTPVAGSPGVWKYQNSLGLWSNRIGILAYAITPFSVLLASRESILSALTGIPYQSFNFFTPLDWLRYPGAKHPPRDIMVHYLHWLVWAAANLRRQLGDQRIHDLRHLRTVSPHHHTLLLHHQWVDGDWGFHPAQARLTSFPDAAGYGDVVRLDFDFVQSPWMVGQHFYLCFPRSSVWQSHPFTPLSLPVVERGVVRHSYIFRAKSGETAKIAAMREETTPVVLQGPYGEHSSEVLGPHVNVLAIAGGTGITYVLPVLLELAAEASLNPQTTSERQVHLLWAVRHSSDAQWVEPELAVLRASAKIRATIFVTREAASPSSDKQSGDQEGSDKESGDQGATTDVRKLGEGQQARHPDVGDLVRTFVGDTVSGRTMVFASGPGSMVADLRSSVAALNDGGQVGCGNERFDVELREDNRLEW
ncbi:hypothetical protein MCOR02_009363 [Pyricularia oryzae]|uniref:FAD-binding FR-type domain-containing protein n=2 Tax=Pyricularia TaxID=48558 RepID=A0ABQ8NC36_PYRGI|nr:hypothetical protein MCOR02_009363 [Pyricularia oryzae]KAI6294694.1 hypothetical protein MCOR33_008260 [Pyricularia grisea]KAI6361118.1 hypothetical protein MCOR31_008821 [Pyricularia oryzae]KAI6423268.1 hypothetical protein MCOR24_003754 [Pyricularia oryzae]KAI6495197.1 hypothetical protein MCOR13_007271 [Pyricularia oryzae]